MLLKEEVFIEKNLDNSKISSDKVIKDRNGEYTVEITYN